MHQHVKDLWTARLRLEPDKQGRGTLHDPDGKLCCLGVLCVLAVEAGVPVSVDVVDENGYAGDAFIGSSDKGVVAYDGCTLIPPPSVLKWAGLTEGNLGADLRVKVPGTGTRTLTYVNDSMQYTFPQIADLIDAQY